MTMKELDWSRSHQAPAASVGCVLAAFRWATKSSVTWDNATSVTSSLCLLMR